jgi:hypothetical protein
MMCIRRATPVEAITARSDDEMQESNDRREAKVKVEATGDED